MQLLHLLANLEKKTSKGDYTLQLTEKTPTLLLLPLIPGMYVGTWYTEFLKVTVGP